MSLVGALFVVGAMSDIIDTPIRGRYAPSPSGDLHLGNLRTALLTWLFARSCDGQFVLPNAEPRMPAPDHSRPTGLSRLVLGFSIGRKSDMEFAL